MCRDHGAACPRRRVAGRHLPGGVRLGHEIAPSPCRVAGRRPRSPAFLPHHASHVPDRDRRGRRDRLVRPVQPVRPGRRVRAAPAPAGGSPGVRAAAARIGGWPRGRGEAALQDGEGEAHGAGPLVVVQGFGAVELAAHVIRDLLVQAGLRLREPVRHAVGDALGKQRPAVELQQALLHHAAHQVGDVHPVHAVPEAALEAVAVEQREEEMEVFLLAVVRGRGHQQEVAREAGEKLPEAVALRVPDLAAEERRRHLVRLVADHEVVTALRRSELRLQVFVAGELVEARDGEAVFEEPVAGAGGVQLVVGQDLEGEMEAAVQLVLPLLGEAAGADHQAAFEVSARDQLLDEQAGHDRLAGAGVVGEQEAQGPARQHGFVDGGDLVGQRLHQGGVHGEHRVEEVREADAVRLGDEPVRGAVAVEAPRAPLPHDFEARFVVAVEDLLGDPARRRAVDQGERVRAVPFGADDGDGGIRRDAAHRGGGPEVFELQAVLSGDEAVTPRSRFDSGVVRWAVGV